MAEIKSAADIGAKYSRITSGRSSDFAAGVKAPRRSWATGAKNGAQNYKDGVTKAANDGRFEKGVVAAGDDKWSRKTTDVGVARWAPGVQAGQKDYVAAMAPVVDTIAKVQLSPRYPKGDPRNYQRVADIGNALTAMKTGTK